MQREEEIYFENFDKKEYLKKGDKILSTAHFTSTGPPNFPKIAVLKEFGSINPNFENEARLLKIFSDLHPNIVKYYYSTQIDGHFRIFMEHCECDSIKRVIDERKKCSEPWTNSELINHFITIADVIKTLHDNNFVHGDMKPDNIFVKENEVLKIGDFGLSKKIELGVNKNFIPGTLNYMSPQCQRLWNRLSADKDCKKRTELPLAKQEELKQNEQSKYCSYARNIHEDEQQAKINSLENLEKDRVLCNECGLETQKDQLIGLIKTSLSIGSESNQVECLNCSNPYPTEIVDSLNNYIN